MQVCSVLWLSLLLSLTAATAAAQQSSAGTAATPISPNPYIQQRTQGTTSFDNPYAPGGIYDPYHGHNPSAPKGKPRTAAGTDATKRLGLANTDGSALSDSGDASGSFDSMRAGRCGGSGADHGSSLSGTPGRSSQAHGCGSPLARSGSQGTGLKRIGQAGKLRQGLSQRPSR
jgi:hypothetical protein